MTSIFSTVIAISGVNTVKVAKYCITKHPVYGKYIKKKTTDLVDNSCGAELGDVVEVQPAKFSKKKTKKITRIVQKRSMNMIKGVDK